MTKFLSGWIVLQLLMIGISAYSVSSSMGKGEWECSNDISYSPIIIIVPLIYFTSENPEWIEYCDTQKLQSK